MYEGKSLPGCCQLTEITFSHTHRHWVSHRLVFYPFFFSLHKWLKAEGMSRAIETWLKPCLFLQEMCVIVALWPPCSQHQEERFQLTVLSVHFIIISNKGSKREHPRQTEKPTDRRKLPQYSSPSCIESLKEKNTNSFYSFWFGLVFFCTKHLLGDWCCWQSWGQELPHLLQHRQQGDVLHCCFFGFFLRGSGSKNLLCLEIKEEWTTQARKHLSLSISLQLQILHLLRTVALQELQVPPCYVASLVLTAETQETPGTGLWAFRGSHQWRM